MAIRSTEELTKQLADILGDRVDDAALAMVEDLADTLADLTTGEDWRAKYEENDKKWRERYKARFMGGPKPGETEEVEETAETEKSYKFEDLFEEG